jgi:hypothetical protein
MAYFKGQDKRGGGNRDIFTPVTYNAPMALGETPTVLTYADRILDPLEVEMAKWDDPGYIDPWSNVPVEYGGTLVTPPPTSTDPIFSDIQLAIMNALGITTTPDPYLTNMAETQGLQVVLDMINNMSPNTNVDNLGPEGGGGVGGGISTGGGTSPPLDWGVDAEGNPIEGMPSEPTYFTNYDGINLQWYDIGGAPDDYGNWAHGNLTLRFDSIPIGVDIYELLDKYNVKYDVNQFGIYLPKGEKPAGAWEMAIDPSDLEYQEWMKNMELLWRKEAIQERAEFMEAHYMPNWFMDLASWRGWG